MLLSKLLPDERASCGVEYLYFLSLRLVKFWNWYWHRICTCFLGLLIILPYQFYLWRKGGLKGLRGRKGLPTKTWKYVTKVRQAAWLWAKPWSYYAPRCRFHMYVLHTVKYVDEWLGLLSSCWRSNELTLPVFPALIIHADAEVLIFRQRLLLMHLLYICASSSLETCSRWPGQPRWALVHFYHHHYDRHKNPGTRASGRARKSRQGGAEGEGGRRLSNEEIGIVGVGLGTVLLWILFSPMCSEIRASKVIQNLEV